MNATRDREDHRGARSDRNRAHVWAHQTTHKGHGQNRGNHREGCQDGRVAYFIHSLNRHLERHGCGFRHPPVPYNVLDHHDRIVNENPDREDECEERDSI